ncbi:hypothetical protein HMPREF3230_00942 [Gardnerella vaginalis]|uniref:Uncharacterized protein n=1 Tax=Gardnerella vaginalis TaxID=2702 RepID=A0A135Z4Z1_GARVA|nr:hypothetical protein [Gardnerella vaginalis]KXI16708.1 hypothetical protein HMPREF3230_00942 [Gardnerella vaginalis]
MGYESISTLLLVIIVIALLFGWLPKLTLKSMKTMLEHREDRYSSSLHLVDEWTNSHMCDDANKFAEGASMQPAKQNIKMITQEHIRKVRQLRRDSIRRRRILVSLLFVLTLVVLFTGFSGLYSPLFALIPFALFSTVIYFGIKASKAAREWESRVKRGEISVYKKYRGIGESAASSVSASDSASASDSDSYEEFAHDNENELAHSDCVDSNYELERENSGNSRENTSENIQNNVENSNDNISENSSENSCNVDDSVATSVMEKREIRIALHRSMQEKKRALESRGIVAENYVDLENGVSTPAVSGVSADSASAEDVQDSVDSSVSKNNEQSSSDSNNSRDLIHSDLTDEINTVRASRGLDVFDLATASLCVDSSSEPLKSHDLISFSLGSSSKKDDSNNTNNSESYAPESLEIKSTKQVAKAVPVESKVANLLNTSEPNRDSIASKNNSCDEVVVEAPERTEDSLGSADLLEVLARRNQN